MANRKGPARLYPETVEEICAYHKLHSLTETAAHFELSLRRIQVIVKNQARPRGQRLWLLDPVLQKAISDGWKNGMTKEAIAKEFRIGRGTVSKLLAKLVPASNTGAASGERHWSWKGGRTTQGDGYVVVIITPSHPFYDSMRYQIRGTSYVLEHRLIMAEHLGRPLISTETVHHINGNRADNRIENLELRVKPHGRGVVLTCGDCGSHNITASALARDPKGVEVSQQTNAVN